MSTRNFVPVANELQKIAFLFVEINIASVACGNDDAYIYSTRYPLYLLRRVPRRGGVLDKAYVYYAKSTVRVMMTVDLGCWCVIIPGSWKIRLLYLL